MNATHRIRCRHCLGAHASVSAVRECAALEAHYADEARAEAEMERRAENFWEEGTEAQRAARFAEAEHERRMLPF